MEKRSVLDKICITLMVLIGIFFFILNLIRTDANAEMLHIRGDVNLDGKVTIADATYLLKALALKPGYSLDEQPDLDDSAITPTPPSLYIDPPQLYEEN